MGGIILSEKQIQETIIAYLHLLELKHVLKFWRQNSGVAKYHGKSGARFVRSGINGISDIVGFFTGGKAFFIEVKRKGGRKRPEQVAFIENAKRYGCIAFFAESLEDVQIEFKKEGFL